MRLDPHGPGPEAGLSTPAPFLSRHLGDYLLVAQLSDDPLGTVFRALYAADERRFVRLRVLQSEELDAASVLLTVKENRLRDLALVIARLLDRQLADRQHRRPGLLGCATRRDGSHVGGVSGSQQPHRATNYR